MGKQQCSLCVCVCVVGLHVTVSYIKILSTAQKYFYGKFMSPVKIVPFPSRNEPDAALRQKNVRLLVAFFRRGSGNNR